MRTRGQALLVQHDLLERDSELAALAAPRYAVTDGGRLLAIEGSPGIGKTALIAQAKSTRPRSPGCWCSVRVAPSSSARSPTAWCDSSSSRLLASLGAEERSASCSTGAAALAAPLFDPAQVVAEPRRGLVAGHASRPLLADREPRRAPAAPVAIDDLHWCDLPSLRWLAYLLPRDGGTRTARRRRAAAGGAWRGSGPARPDRLRSSGRRDPARSLSIAGSLPAPTHDASLPRPTRPSAPPAGKRRPAIRCSCVSSCTRSSTTAWLRPRRMCPACASSRRGPARAPSRSACPGSHRRPRALARAVAILGDDADPRQAAALAGSRRARPPPKRSRALARVDVLHPQLPLRVRSPAHPLGGLRGARPVRARQRARQSGMSARRRRCGPGTDLRPSAALLSGQ